MFLQLLSAEVPDSVAVFQLMVGTIRDILIIKRRDTYCMSPCTGTGGKVTPAGVPLGVGHRVVVSGAEVLNATAPGRSLAAGLLDVEVEVPELKLRLAR